MFTYHYKGTDKNGKISNGIIEAADEHEVAAELDKKGCIPIRIRLAKKQQSRGLSSNSFSLPQIFSKRISSKSTQIFTQDLAILLKAGLPLDRSLEILIEASKNEKNPFEAVTKDILHSVEKGHSLSDALMQHPKLFNHFYISMVRAGEAGGVLEDVLERMGNFLETAQELKDYVISALLYPAFLSGVGLISIILLLTFVIPRFSMIFESMGQSIPLSTQLILSLSSGLKNWWWLILGVLCTFTIIVYRYFSTEYGRSKLDKWVLILPVIGNLVRRIEVARFTRTLGTMVHSGVPILQSLELVTNILSNRTIVSSLQTVQNRVKEGEKLAGPLQDTNVFPPVAIQMIMVGEETGQLDTMLLRVADIYEKIVRNLIKRFVNLLEPVLILVMGLVIGAIVISMLMAIFSLNDLPF